MLADVQVVERSAERSRSISRSALHEVHDLVQQLGPHILPLHIGEPHITIPETVRDAYVKAIRDGHSYYCDAPGLSSLREALSARFHETQGVSIPSSHIFVTPGSCQAIAGVLLSLAFDGGSVLVPEIHWPMHLQQILMAGLKPRFYKQASPDRSTVEALDDAYEPDVCAIIVTSPSNPAGIVLDAPTTAAIHAWAKRHAVYVLSDEAYEDFVFEGEPSSMARLDATLPERERIVFSIHTFSKSFSLTGYRVGYVATPNVERAELLRRVQEALLVSPATPVQFAALAALSDRSHVNLHRQYVQATCDKAVKLLGPPGLLWATPQGGWYALLDLSRVTSKADEFCRRLLDEAEVAVAPGRAFTPQGHPLSGRLARIALCRERAATLRGIELILEWSKK